MKLMKKATPTQVAVAAALAVASIGAAHAQALNLDEVVVTGTATRASKMKQSVSVSSVSTEAIEVAAPNNAAEVLRSIPGIRAESTGGDSNANINVRGLPSPDGGARFAQFQEDGLPVMLFGDIQFGTADTFLRVDSNLDRLEVTRGGSASVATSNAPGGIMNFISKTGDEKGGTIGITKGLNFDRTRLDLGYGGPISDTTRFYVGGYLRQGEGVRTAGKNAEDGHHIKGNITHDLGKGDYVRVNFKSLSDQTPTFLPAPMQRNGSTLTPYPGYDPLTGFSTPKGLVDVGTNAFGQRVTTDLSTGLTAKSNAVGGEVNLNLDSGWKLNDKFRISDNSGSFAGFISPNKVGGAQALAAELASSLNVAGSVTAKYRNSGLAAGNDTAWVGHLFNVKMNDFSNAVNDLKASKSFTLDGAKVDTTLGLFAMTQKLNMDWIWSSYLLSMDGKNPQVIDILNSSNQNINALGTGYANGANQWGNCCVRSYNLKYTQTAPYASVAWEKGPVNADAGIRLDNMQASGSYKEINQASKAINYSFTKPAFTAGANYRFNNDLSGFGRFSQGTRFGADRVAGGSAINPTTGAALDQKSLFDSVDQYEIGAKYRNGNFSLFNTLFASKTRINSYEANQGSFSAEYESKGVELEAGYRIGALRIAGGVTYTDAEITKHSNPARIGHTPRRQAKWVYQLAPTYTMGDWVIGSSLYGTSKSYAQDDNAFVMPAYRIVNAFAAYSIDKNTTASLSVNNLFNKIGITEVEGAPTSTYFSPRTTTGRTLQASLKYNF